MQERPSHNLLRERFFDQIVAFENSHPVESVALAGELTLWGASVGQGLKTTLWDCIETQINFNVVKRNQKGQTTSSEEFLEYLFTPNQEGEITAEMVMNRLQVG